jgi:hypothetical protein
MVTSLCLYILCPWFNFPYWLCSCQNVLLPIVGSAITLPRHMDERAKEQMEIRCNDFKDDCWEKDESFKLYATITFQGVTYIKALHLFPQSLRRFVM